MAQEAPAGGTPWAYARAARRLPAGRGGSSTHKAVLAWEAYMREFEHVEASTVRRRLAALSSLFKHLIKHGAADRKPVRDVERPPINRREGFTPAFSQAQARQLLDAPSPNTMAGLRDRAILSVGLQAAYVGLRSPA